MLSYIKLIEFEIKHLWGKYLMEWYEACHDFKSKMYIIKYYYLVFCTRLPISAFVVELKLTFIATNSHILLHELIRKIIILACESMLNRANDMQIIIHHKFHVSKSYCNFIKHKFNVIIFWIVSIFKFFDKLCIYLYCT